MADVFASLICRPPRKVYKMEELGPAHFNLGDQECSRKDFELINCLGIKIQCSHYLPATRSPVPCVVYLHGNSGSRIDADDLVDNFLLQDISVLSLDFSGCGMSDGDYVTLGMRERHDLEAVLAYLKGHEKVSKVAIYGRSMGAATAVVVAADDSYAGLISCMVLDSVYSSVATVVTQLAGKYVGKVPLIPWEGMIAPAVEMLRGAVRCKADFDFNDLKLMDASIRCKAPALFGHAGGDELVFPSHSHDMHRVYGGPKSLDVFEGDHNSVRPTSFIQSAIEHVKLHTSGASGEAGGGMSTAASWLGSLGLRISCSGQEAVGVAPPAQTLPLTPPPDPSCRVHLDSTSPTNQEQDRQPPHDGVNSDHGVPSLPSADGAAEQACDSSGGKQQQEGGVYFSRPSIKLGLMLYALCFVCPAVVTLYALELAPGGHTSWLGLA